MGDKHTFVLYTEYWDHIKLLSMEERGSLLTAIMCNECGIELPEMDAATKMAFSFIRGQLDRDRQKYEETCAKRSAAGMASAEARRNRSQQKATKSTHVKSVETKPTNATEYDNEYEYDNDFKRKEIKEKKRFVPPTVDEVAAYCAERKSPVNPERFVDFYASKGWKVGNQPMKDWKACVRTWEKRDSGKPAQKPKNAFNRFQQREYSEDDLERMLVEGMS